MKSRLLLKQAVFCLYFLAFGAQFALEKGTCYNTA